MSTLPNIKPGDLFTARDGSELIAMCIGLGYVVFEHTATGIVEGIPTALINKILTPKSK